MTRKHDAALEALVATSALTNFFPGIAPKGTVAPYAVYWPGDGARDTDRLAGPLRTYHPRWTIHCVGSTIAQAQWVFEQIEKTLIVNFFGVTPVVEGERPGPFWLNPIPYVQRDDDSTPPLFWVTAEAGFASDIL